MKLKANTYNNIVNRYINNRPIEYINDITKEHETLDHLNSMAYVMDLIYKQFKK